MELVAAISYGAAKLWAIPVTLVALAVVGGLLFLGPKRRAQSLRRRAQRAGVDAVRDQLNARAAELEQTRGQSRFSSLLGADGRLSTSKTVAAAWTAIVAYVLITLLFSWPGNWSDALKHLSPTYLLLLGGPYASLVLSKGIVNGKLSGGTLQKPPGDGIPRLSDLVADDSGQADLFDGQYVLFNLIAMGYVIDAFVRATTLTGFPPIPDGLLLLTGGPAAIYIVNKAATSNQPLITAILPSAALPGDTLSVIGQNFRPDAPAGIVGAPVSASDPVTVAVGGVQATGVTATDARITAVVPVPHSSPSGALEVSVITSGGQQVVQSAALTVLPPSVSALNLTSAKIGDPVQLSGKWSAAAGIDPEVVVGGVRCAEVTQASRGSMLTFQVPPLPVSATPVDVQLKVGPQVSQESAKLTITA